MEDVHDLTHNQGDTQSEKIEMLLRERSMMVATAILVDSLSEDCTARLRDGLVCAASKAALQRVSHCSTENRLCLCQGYTSSVEGKELQLQVCRRAIVLFFLKCLIRHPHAAPVGGLMRFADAARS